MNRRLTVLGSILLAFGAFAAPVARMPFVGSLTYDSLTHRGAVLLALIALLGLVASVRRLSRIIPLVLAGSATTILALSYAGLHGGASNPHSLSGALAASLVSAVRLDWGAFVLLLSVACIAGSALVPTSWQRPM